MKNNNHFIRKLLLILTFSTFFISSSKGQPVENRNRITVHLTNGTTVTLFGRYNSMQSAATSLADRPMSKDYYYLPPHLKLSTNPESGNPVFLFLKYVTEEREDQGGVSGALLHLNCEWGLTEAERLELEQKLTAKIPGAKVLGPLELFPVADSYRITSAVMSDKELTKTSLSSGRAPLIESGKFAIAANLQKYGAQLMAATFEKASGASDLSIDFYYIYQTMVTGCKGSIVLDYTKFASAFNSLNINGKQTYYNNDDKDDKTTNETLSYSQMQQAYSALISSGAIVFHMECMYDDGNNSKIKELFFQYFVEKFSLPEDDTKAEENKDPDTSGMPKMNTGIENSDEDDRRVDRTYSVNLTKIKAEYVHKTSVITFSEDFPIVWEGAVSGNLGAWYNGLKNNKTCVSSVNLNDPFYKHMDIRFVLDLEAKEMFEKEVNFVTVNVRKKRSSGNPFISRVTFDQKFIAEKGITAAMTYAGGEDKNPEMYEYASQWSLRGGNVFPENPAWQKGKMEAVTLIPPIMPRTITFEADPTDMKLANLVRATLQVRYMKFGKELEANLPISIAKGEPEATQMIFMDRNTSGYAYRIIYNHKEEGKLATDWDAKINDDYVYATIPEQFRDKSSSAFQKAKEAAKTIISPSPDGTVTSDKVLDGFQELFGVVKDVMKK